MNLPMEFFKKLIEFEGAYSNHPNDPGGETIYGITITNEPEAFQLIKKYYDEQHFDAALTIAKVVYDLKYFEASVADDILETSTKISHQIFDMAVNMGIKGSHKVFQKSINKYNNNSDLVVDGAFGEKSMLAFKAVKDFKKLNNIIVDSRIEYYNSISEANPKLKVFLNGWKKRAEFFRI